jgi:hypothetical protein
MAQAIVGNICLSLKEKFMNALSGIGLLTLLTLSNAAFAVGPAPRPNTHTVIINGQTQTFANLPGSPAASTLNTAYYQLRVRISATAQCNRFGTDTDNAMMNGSLSDEQKTASFKSIEAAAQAAQCLTP